MLERARVEVVTACRTLSRQGWVVGTAGNVSVRDGDLVAISPSGLAYDDLETHLVGVHRLDGSPVQAPLAPSSELPLHLRIYASSTHRAVVHTHSPASTAVSTLVEEVPAVHYYCALFGGPIAVAPYARFGTDELADGAAAALAGRRGALLANHGAVLAGDRVTTAMSLVPYLEYICEVYLRAAATGLPIRCLDADELASAQAALAGYGQSPTTP